MHVLCFLVTVGNPVSARATNAAQSGVSQSTLHQPTRLASTAHAQTWRPPAEEARCPSKWGAGDERGSANHMGSATVLRATQLIRQGEVVELGESSPFLVETLRGS